jgi:putative PIN family toxin of toxin-antitoxin system
MKQFKIVLDTNIIYSAVRSKRGMSYRLLSKIDEQKYKIQISVPLILEYEDVLKRNLTNLILTESDIDDLIDYLCKVGEKRKIYYLWRPVLKDIKDDFILELAVESESDYIITYNIKDFKAAENFNIKVITLKEFLTKLGEDI